MHSIYTDLACEARELHPEIDGVREETEEGDGILITRTVLETDEAAKKLGKAKGNYVTLDAPALSERPLDLFSRVSAALSKELHSLFPELKNDASVLIVGLGNRNVTPDSLGPRIIDQIYVTRHVSAYLPDAFSKPVFGVCAVAPGVLGVTGIETIEIVRGVVEHVKPSLIIVLDSLASRRSSRIGCTVQITDTGISPGSGVGNTQEGINGQSFSIPVIAVGIPLVVYASTITGDAISLMAEEHGLKEDEETLKKLADKLLEEHLGPMIVTPKDIDAIVNDMSRVLADGINMALFGASYEEVRMLIA